MNHTLRVLMAVCLAVSSLFAQPVLPIYNQQQPEIFPLWYRVADFSPRLRAVEAAEISPDGRWAVSGSKFGYKVMLWRIADGALAWEREHESEVECVAFSPDSKRVVTGGEDYFVRVWDVATGTQLHRWEHDSGLDGITWSNNGKFIASGSEEGEAYLWDADTYQLIGKVKTGSTINSLQFTKDDNHLVVGGNNQYLHPQSGKKIYDGFASLIDVAQRKIIRQYKGMTGSVKSVRISADEKWLATGGFDSTARVFDFQTAQLAQTFRFPSRVEAVAFSPDNTFLAVGSHEAYIGFFRLADWAPAYQLPCPRVEYLDFSQDGRLLLTAHEDSGLLSLYLFLSNSGKTGVYQRISDQQLNNRDLKNE